MWSEAQKKFLEEAVQMTTNLWNLRAKVEEGNHEIEEWNYKIEQLKMEIERKDCGMKELQSQLTIAKMETQVWHK